MPAKSEAQRRLMGAALAAKRRGNCKSTFAAARKVCNTMNTRQLREYAMKVRKARAK